MKITILIISLAILNFIIIDLYMPQTEIDVTNGCTGDDEVVEPGWGYFLLFSFFFVWIALYVSIEDITKWKT